MLLLVICWSCVSRGPVLREGERVTIPGNGIDVAGILYRPDKSTGSASGIIVLHGWSQYDTNGAETVAIPAWLFSREGYVALALSLRGWPDTGGKDACGGKQPYDVAAAINWLARQPGVNPGKIGLVQHGNPCPEGKVRGHRLCHVTDYLLPPNVNCSHNFS